ncbi:hypothetical protein M9458_014596, partial [Cirrhinus mrigala]
MSHCKVAPEGLQNSRHRKVCGKDQVAAVQSPARETCTLRLNRSILCNVSHSNGK